MYPSQDVWAQNLYLAPYNYIVDANIVEYDIEKANISVLYSKGAISKSTYEGLLKMPKMDREVAVGRMIRREKEIYEVLSQGIMEARKSLCDQLGIMSEDILAIKNDAVFVLSGGTVNLPENVWTNEVVKFRIKGHYRSFYKVFRKEFYYNYDPITSKESLDIKGVGDYGVEKCNQLIGMLCDLFYTVLVAGPKPALDKANEIYLKYINKQYPIELYRRLDSHAMYDIVDISNYCRFQAEMLPEDSKYAVDSAYNAEILRLFISYFTGMYMPGN